MITTMGYLRTLMEEIAIQKKVKKQYKLANKELRQENANLLAQITELAQRYAEARDAAEVLLKENHFVKDLLVTAKDKVIKQGEEIVKLTEIISNTPPAAEVPADKITIDKTFFARLRATEFAIQNSNLTGDIVHYNKIFDQTFANLKSHMGVK